jgi:cell division protein FtsL
MSGAVRKFKETVDIQSLLLKRLRSHHYFPIAVVVGALLTVACIHVWQRVHVIKLVAQVGELRRTNRELVDHAYKMHNDIAALSMATRIELYAADTLGMQPVAADRLFTLVRERDKEVPPDELATILSAIKRVAHYFPVLSENYANAGELMPIRFDSTRQKGDGE